MLNQFCMDSGSLHHCSITQPLLETASRCRGSSPSTHPASASEIAWQSSAAPCTPKHSWHLPSQRLGSETSTPVTQPLSSFSQHQWTMRAWDQSVWRAWLAERKAFTTKAFGKQYPLAESTARGQSADSRHGTTCNHILKDATTRRPNFSSLYFVLPDPLWESILDKKGAKAQEVSSKGTRNPQLCPVTCLRVQQCREGLRNQISYSEKKKSTSKYVVWQNTARKHREKKNGRAPPSLSISSMLWFISFPFQTCTGSW